MQAALHGILRPTLKVQSVRGNGGHPTALRLAGKGGPGTVGPLRLHQPIARPGARLRRRGVWRDGIKRHQRPRRGLHRAGGSGVVAPPAIGVLVGDEEFTVQVRSSADIGLIRVRSRYVT